MTRKTINEIDGLGKLFILTMGAPASGKSTFVKEFLSKYKIIDVDDLVTEIGGGIYDRKNVSAGIHLMKNSVLKGLKSGETIVNVSTSKNFKSLSNKLKTAHEHGYSTFLLVFDVPTEICIERNKNRRKNGGRGLADEYEWKIVSTNQQIKENFELLKSTNLVNYYDELRNYLPKV